MNYCILVNKNNKIKDNYLKKIDLVNYHSELDKDILIEKRTKKAYLSLKNYLKNLNIEIGIDSAFRTKQEQKEIIDSFLIEYGEDYVKKFVAQLGYSEHETGLALDLVIKVNNKFIIENEELEKYDSIFQKIHNSLNKFGFILRYSKDKEKITGYSYEAWHIRYVGEIPATIIYNNNLTLEEYLTIFSGILVINKEINMTSRDVVNEVSNLLGLKKIGHTGTLDPLAQGVLVLTIGRATKIGELLTSYEKEYIAGVETGKLTDTLDITGKILQEKKVTKKIDYQKLLKTFQKTYLQEVPIYSAVKIKGKKLYEYAREQKEIALPKKEVTIKEISLLKSDSTSFIFKTLVSKGTYIRSLIRDMGISINELFTMSSLIRTKQGDFSITDSYKISDIKNNSFKILKIEDVLKYPIIDMDKNLYTKVANGCIIENNFNITSKVLFKRENNLIAIYQKDGNNLKIWKMINNK